MRVLLTMLSPANAVGGMEKHFVELANGLAESGHQITCACAREHMAALHPTIKKCRVNSKASRYSPVLYFELVQVLNAQAFDIAHAQGSKAADVFRWLSPLFPGTKFIATIHGFKSRYPKPRTFHRIIAVSKALAPDIGSKNVSVVYNRLRPPADPVSEVGLPEGLIHPVWLAVGRLVTAKGFDNLISTFQHVNGSLIIAGSGPELPNLKTRIDEQGLSHRVKLIGHHNDIWSLMKSVDAVVISSRREGFSYVFAEALISGKPIISTNVPIANEFLPQSCIIPENSTQEIFSGFLNRDLREIHSEQGSARSRSRTELMLHAMIENTLSVYYDCLDS